MLRRVASIWLRLPAWQAAALIALCCVAVYGPGAVLLPVVDRDEARFAQASRQMLESVLLEPEARDGDLHGGGLAVPMVGGRERINKPPMIYWLQAASAGVLTLGDPLTDAIWMYRVPSLSAAVVTLLVLRSAASRRFGPRVGLLAAVMLGVSPLFFWEARQARADMVLVAATTVAMASLWSCFDGRGWTWRTPFVLWLAVAVGTLTKGPVTPMVVVLAMLLLSLAARRWRWVWNTKPWLGVLMVLGTMGPWLWAVGTHVGHEALWRRLYDETLGRSVEPAEGHGGPPGYHLVLAAALFWPGAMLAGKAFLAAATGVVKSVRGPSRPRSAVLFLAAWLLPVWLVMELVSTKLPHYVLPLYPALAILSAREVVRFSRTPASAVPAVDRFGLGLWRAIGAVLTVAVPVALAVVVDPLWWFIAAALLLAGRGVAPSPIGTDRWSAQHRALLAGAALALLVPAGLGLSERLHVTRAVDEIIEFDQVLEDDVAIGSVRYHEDSLMFATRGRLDRLAPGGVESFVSQHPIGVLILPPDIPFTLGTEIGRVRGFNYSKGRDVELRVLRFDRSDRGVTP